MSQKCNKANEQNNIIIGAIDNFHIQNHALMKNVDATFGYQDMHEVEKE